MLLKVGRHIRPDPAYKLIISREEGEGRFLQGYRQQYPSLKTVSHAGPLCLIDGTLTDQQLKQAARIVARYSQGKNADAVELEYRDTQGATRSIQVKPLEPHALKQEWMI